MVQYIFPACEKIKLVLLFVVVHVNKLLNLVNWVHLFEPPAGVNLHFVGYKTLYRLK